MHSSNIIMFCLYGFYSFVVAAVFFFTACIISSIWNGTTTTKKLRKTQNDGLLLFSEARICFHNSQPDTLKCVSSIENIDEYMNRHTSGANETIQNRNPSDPIRFNSCIERVFARYVLFKWNDEWIIKWKHYTKHSHNSIDQSKKKKRIRRSKSVENIAWKK